MLPILAHPGNKIALWCLRGQALTLLPRLANAANIHSAGSSLLVSDPDRCRCFGHELCNQCCHIPSAGLEFFSRRKPWQRHHTAAFVCLQHEEAIMKMIQKRGPQPPEETDLWACVSRLKDKSGGMGAMCRTGDVLGFLEWSVKADLTRCL